MSLDNDAREFGQHFKQGGWRLGLLVARNVEPHKGQGKPRPPVDEAASPLSTPDGVLDEKPSKVSGTEFATKAGVSKQHVANYYKAWELAADDHKCLHAKDLSPGDEDLEDLEEEDVEHTRELWSKYLQMAKEPKEPKEPKATGNTHASGANNGTPDTKVGQAVEALTKTSEQLSKNLVKVIDGVGPKLMSEDAELAQFAEELRRTRSVLDKYCQEIDRVLARIGFGDAEDQPVSIKPAAGTESN